MRQIESEPKNSWEAFSEANAIESLRSKGVDNVELAFEIEDEKTAEGVDVNAEQIYWMKLDVPQTEEKEGLIPIEGKIYFPKEPNGELLLFTPGFPGGNAGRFEKIYGQAFLDAGYTFFTIRHNGASLTNGKTSLDILNSQKRMDIAKQANEHHIGGTREEGYRPDEMINEPVVALSALHKRFNKIHLMGQSMGVASNYNAVTVLKDHPEITGKIGNIVGIAGYVGGERGVPDGVWEGQKNFDGKGKYPDGTDGLIAYELDYVKQVDLNFALNAEQFKDSLAKVAKTNQNMEVPDNAGNILVYTPEDPLIAGPDLKDDDAVANYGPKSRKKLIIEDHSKPAENKKAHSMLWIKPENLVRAVKAKVSSFGPHFIKVGEKK